MAQRSVREPLQAIQFGTIVGNSPDSVFTISINKLDTEWIRTNSWKQKRMQTGNGNPLHWNNSQKRWTTLAVKSSRSHKPKPKIQILKVQIQARYSVCFCKNIEGKSEYSSSKRNHSRITLSDMNLRQQSDIGKINQLINIMYELITKDVSTSQNNGKLVHRKSHEIKLLFNKTKFPNKLK